MGRRFEINILVITTTQPFDDVCKFKIFEEIK